MELQLTDRVLELPKTLWELSLNKYFGVMKVFEKMPQDPELLTEYLETLDGQLDFFDLVESIIDDADSIKVGDLDKVNEYISNLIVDSLNPPTNINPYIDVEGVRYATRTIKEMNDLDAGEYISIKIYQEKFANDIYGFAPYVLAILVRPAIEEKDDETGEVRWIQSKFDKRDIANLEWRANKFLSVPAGEIIPVLNFFLNMKDKT